MTGVSCSGLAPLPAQGHPTDLDLLRGLAQLRPESVQQPLDVVAQVAQQMPERSETCLAAGSAMSTASE